MKQTRLGCNIFEGSDIANLPLLSENSRILDNAIKDVEDAMLLLKAQDIKLDDGKTIQETVTKINTDIGNKGTLKTEHKASIVGAINEIITKLNSLSDKVGNLQLLNTQTKSSIVGSINELFTNVSDGKQLIAQAITDKGVVTSGGHSFMQMATNIGMIETDTTGDATATSDDILYGKTAYVKGQKLTGSMANRGNASGTITSQGGSINITPGYYTGGNIGANITNLTGANIKSSVAVGGVTGNFTDDGTATSGDMLSGKVAYSKGQKVTGSITPRGNASGTIKTQGGTVSISPGYYTGGSISANISGLYASNIKQGVSVGGVVGDYKGEPLTGQEIILKQDDFIQFNTDQTKYVYTIPAIYKNYHTIKIRADGYSSWRSNTYIAGTKIGEDFSADNTDRPDIIYSHSTGSVSLKNTRGRDSYLDYEISYYL